MSRPHAAAQTLQYARNILHINGLLRSFALRLGAQLNGRETDLYHASYNELFAYYGYPGPVSTEVKKQCRCPRKPHSHHGRSLTCLTFTTYTCLSHFEIQSSSQSGYHNNLIQLHDQTSILPTIPQALSKLRSRSCNSLFLLSSCRSSSSSRLNSSSVMPSLPSATSSSSSSSLNR